MLRIKITSEFSNSTGRWYPAVRTELNQRINHRGSKTQSHILNVFTRLSPTAHGERLIEYENRCIERGTKPHHYTDAQWQQVLTDETNERHTEQCEHINAWRYEH